MNLNEMMVYLDKETLKMRKYRLESNLSSDYAYLAHIRMYFQRGFRLVAANMLRTSPLY